MFGGKTTYNTRIPAGTLLARVPREEGHGVLVASHRTEHLNTSSTNKINDILFVPG